MSDGGKSLAEADRLCNVARDALCHPQAGPTRENAPPTATPIVDEEVDAGAPIAIRQGFAPREGVFSGLAKDWLGNRP